MSLIKSNDSSISITALNAFSDNYLWVISNGVNAALVDPGDADVCIKFLIKSQLTLTSILITHHHADHTGGIEKLVSFCKEKQWPLTIYGPEKENIPYCDNKLSGSDIVNITELSIEFTTIDLPGHTAGHIAYFAKINNQPVVFCGDTLFSGGCGRLFEGTPEQMLQSLNKLKALPENTKVYCAHEYTQANLVFALTVDPENKDLINYKKKVDKLRSKNQSTIPTTIKVEKLINPFLRSHTNSIKVSAIKHNKNKETNTLESFTTIRLWKDQF